MVQETETNRKFNENIDQFRTNILEIVDNIHLLDYYLDESKIDYIIYPLPDTIPFLYKPLDYFDFDRTLTGNLEQEQVKQYYQKEIRQILLIFDVGINGEQKISGSGKKREFTMIQSNDLFQEFLESVGGSDGDSDGDDEGRAASSVGNDNYSRAKAFIESWDIPFLNVEKDACGDRDKVNYIEVANEHLRKIDIFSNKSSFHLYREIHQFISSSVGNTTEEYKELLDSLLQVINKKNLHLHFAV